MATYSEYNTVICQKIGSTEEGFWTPAMRAQAINDAVREVLDNYDLPEMMKRSTLTFDALGVVAKPSDFYKMVRLFSVDSNNVELNKYEYTTPIEFEQFHTTDTYYWTEDYDTTSAAIRLKCKPITAGTLQVRYIKEYTTVVTTSATDDGLSSRWKEPIAMLAAVRLLMNSGEALEVAKANTLQSEAFRLLAVKFSSLGDSGGNDSNPRIKSYYETHTLLN